MACHRQREQRPLKRQTSAQHAQRLDWLIGRPGKNSRVRIAPCAQERTIGCDVHHRAAVSALDESISDDLSNDLHLPTFARRYSDRVSSDLDDFHAVIPAGGAGTRLWPLSRAGRPKFLLDLDGSGRTLIQQTWDRLNALVPADRIHIVTGAAHADAIREQLPDVVNVLIEPSPRNSMPAIGWAAAVVAQQDPAAIIGSFAADHVISDDAAFADAIGQAVATARTGLVTTIGVTPTEPSTAFGYIRAGEALAINGAATAVRIDSFVEKPDAATAEQYLAAGGYTWNAGMFVVGAEVLLGHLDRLQPTLAAGLRTIAADPSTLDATWPTLTSIAIDHAVAEPVSLDGGMAVIPARFGWDDVGDFAALETLRGSDSNTLFVDGDGLALASDGTLIAVLGLRDVIVVRTPDAVLVTSREHTQRVGEIPKTLKSLNRSDLT